MGGPASIAVMRNWQASCVPRRQSAVQTPGVVVAVALRQGRSGRIRTDGARFEAGGFCHTAVGARVDADADTAERRAQRRVGGAIDRAKTVADAARRSRIGRKVVGGLDARET